MEQRALLFTDVVDSTRVVQRLGDESAAALWAEHDRLARALLAEHDGLEIDRSDGFFLLFNDVLDAAQFAKAYHAGIEPLGISARLGIHVGPVTLRANPPEAGARGAKPVEVEGLAKPLAARVMALAAGGQTLLSSHAAQALQANLPTGLQLRTHGHYRLKGIEEPHELFELGDARCGFAPPPDVDKAYRVVRDGDLWKPVREIPHNIAPESDAFIGRVAELRRLAETLEAGARLVSVLGVGGTGKTRLVRRYARAWLGDWPGGVYFCDLTEAASLEGICFAVATSIGVPLGKDDPVMQLGHAIAARGRCLVIADNFEQVVEQGPATLSRWLERAGQASFLVTTRERLHLPGEVLVPVEPLRVDSEAIELFAVRARSQLATFALDDATRVPVAEIARLLDGLPLAIELAAARIRVLSPSQIVERLRDRFALLASSRGAAARQATLKAAIDWSWDHLTPCEQSALAQCSVFEGGFTLEAAEAVIDLAAWPDAPPVMDVVHSLVDKSLVRAWTHKVGARLEFAEPYFGMYLSIHEYAAERLKGLTPTAAQRAKCRHGEHFARLGTDTAIDALSTHGGVQRWYALALEADNLSVACHRAMERGDGTTAAACYRALWRVLELQGPHSLLTALGPRVLELPIADLGLRLRVELLLLEGLERTGHADAALRGWTEILESPPEALDATRRAGIQVLAARVHVERGRFEQARLLLEDALASRRAAGDAHGQARALVGQAMVAAMQGRLRDAVPLLEQAVALFAAYGDRRSEARTLGNLAMVLTDLDPIAARPVHEAALTALRETGNRADEGIALCHLANVLEKLGLLDEAAEIYGRALVRCREVGYRRYEAVTLTNLATVHLVQGRLREAWSMACSAAAIHREVGNLRAVSSTLGVQAEVLLEQEQPSGAVEILDEAIAIARGLGHRQFLATHQALLARAHEQLGAVALASELLASAEAALREVGDQVQLAEVLCQRVRMAITSGDLAAARAAHDEARGIAVHLRLGEGSLLGRELTALAADIDAAARQR